MGLSSELQVEPAVTADVDVRQVQSVICEVLSRAYELDQGQVSSRLSEEELPANATRPGQVTIVLTGDDRIRQLNCRYRGVDSVTDVLAFGGTSEGFVEAPAARTYLGDVIISYPRVMAQAEEGGHSLVAELALLVTHGVLHLLGYDHLTPRDKAIMWAKQEAILEQVRLCWPIDGPLSLTT
jgi:probable rRNA maturation factor